MSDAFFGGGASRPYAEADQDYQQQNPENRAGQQPREAAGRSGSGQRGPQTQMAYRNADAVPLPRRAPANRVVTDASLGGRAFGPHTEAGEECQQQNPEGTPAQQSGQAAGYSGHGQGGEESLQLDKPSGVLTATKAPPNTVVTEMAGQGFF